MPPVALNATSMLRGSPQHHGAVRKLHIPLLYSFLPRFIQRLILRFLPFLAPSWRAWYLILLGAYLYKFEAANSNEPKGSPLGVESIDKLYLVSNEELDRSLTMTGTGSIFCVTTVLGKKHYYQAEEDAELWIRSLGQARQEAIRRRLGHAPEGSYPPAWAAYDRLGESCRQRKERVKRRVEELEMRSLVADDGGVMPRGYFG